MKEGKSDLASVRSGHPAQVQCTQTFILAGSGSLNRGAMQ